MARELRSDSPVSTGLFDSSGEDRYPGGSHKPVHARSTRASASISPCAPRFADSPAREIGAGFPHFEAPMLIIIALILAASVIAMQAAGLWVEPR